MGVFGVFSETRQIRGVREALAVVFSVAAFGLSWAAFEDLAQGTGLAETPRRTGTGSDSDPDGDAKRDAEPRLHAPLPDVPLPDVPEWLVDGYNVLHAGLLGGAGDRGRWWTEASRQRVIERGLAFRNSHPGGGPSGEVSVEHPVEVWVVFDGARPATDESPNCSGLHTVFAPSADDWLVQRVRAAADPTALAVVTADRQVGGRARHRGAHVVAPIAWLASCPQP